MRWNQERVCLIHLVRQWRLLPRVAPAFLSIVRVINGAWEVYAASWYTAGWEVIWYIVVDQRGQLLKMVLHLTAWLNSRSGLISTPTDIGLIVVVIGVWSWCHCLSGMSLRSGCVRRCEWLNFRILRVIIVAVWLSWSIPTHTSVNRCIRWYCRHFVELCEAKRFKFF